jgi:hypothetical protein
VRSDCVRYSCNPFIDLLRCMSPHVAHSVRRPSPERPPYSGTGLGLSKYGLGDARSRNGEAAGTGKRLEFAC